jgi:hypothetical protein
MEPIIVPPATPSSQPPVQPPPLPHVVPDVVGTKGGASPIKKPASILKVILIVLAVAAISGAAGYLFARNNIFLPLQRGCTMEAKLCPDGSSVGRSGPNCEFSPCPTPTPDPTADWKTYTNNQYNFSFKYPGDWENITSSQAITNSNREFMLQTNRGEFVNGTVFDQKSESQNVSWSRNISLPNDKELLIVYLDNIGPGSTGGTKDIQIFDQILSTFTFSEPESSTDTSMWKTYTSNSLGISFKYPADSITVNEINDRIIVKLTGLFDLLYFDSSPDSDFCAAALPVNQPEITSISLEGRQYSVVGCFFGSGGSDGGGSVTSYVANITSNFKVVIVKTYEHTYDSNGREVPTKQTSPGHLQLATQILSTFKFTQ